MRRIAIILSALFFSAALAAAERPQMPPIEEPPTKPAPAENAAPSAPTMPMVRVEEFPAPLPPEKIETPAPPVETRPAFVETQRAIVETQPQAPADTQPAEEIINPPTSLPAVVVEEVRQKAELQFSFLADHSSGIYYAKEEANISVIVELPSWATEPQTLAGQFTFMAVPEFGKPQQPLSVTPIQEAKIAPGKRVKLTVAATFPAPGEYVLALGNKFITGVGGVTLRCALAPRGVDGKVVDNSWIAKLPEGAAEIPGFVADYAKRTGIRRFVLDETWGPTLTPEVKVLTKGRRELLLKNLAEAKANIVLRLALTSAAKANAKDLLAMNRYVATFVSQAKGSIAAICLSDDLPLDQNEIDRARQYYFAIYDAAKKQNKSTLLLGISSAFLTQIILTEPKKGESLRSYVDALCAEGSAFDVKRGLDLAAKKEWKGSPLWVLPGGGMETAAIKAIGAASVPIYPSERNVPAHLLGGAVLHEQLHPESLPFVAIFQGDGFAVAAIAGKSAGTLFDAPLPKIFGKEPRFESGEFLEAAGKVVEPHLEIGDDTNSMRVVDARGGAVDCRVGDLLKVPVGDQLYYVLATGSAEDLASLLRVALPRGVRIVEPGVAKFVAPKAAEKGSLEILVRNVSPAEISGEAVLIGADGEIGSPHKFAAIAAGKDFDASFALPSGMSLENLHVEFRFKGIKEVQRDKFAAGR